MPTVTAASQPGLITDKWCYLCTPPCEPRTDTDYLIKPDYQISHLTIQPLWIVIYCVLRSSLHVKISPLLLHLWTTPPPSFVLSLTCPVWWGVGFSIGDRNRQVFRCVMFDMLTQHAFITGRRQVWQQRLPDHDYIISWCAAEGQGRAPQSKTKHLWDSGSRRLKSLKSALGLDLPYLLTLHTILLRYFTFTCFRRELFRTMINMWHSQIIWSANVYYGLVMVMHCWGYSTLNVTNTLWRKLTLCDVCCQCWQELGGPTSNCFRTFTQVSQLLSFSWLKCISLYGHAVSPNRQLECVYCTVCTVWVTDVLFILFSGHVWMRPDALLHSIPTCSFGDQMHEVKRICAIGNNKGIGHLKYEPLVEQRNEL